MNDFLLVDKPDGISSFGVVARVRRILSEKAGYKVKVGHAGTLDPFATGLLIVLVGKGTKRSNEFLKLDKRYDASIKLGYISTTGDPEGEILETEAGKKVDKKPVTREEIEKVVAHFVGEIEQRVPIYSAVKIKGERAYRLARKGIDVEMPVRKVQIFELKIIEYQWPILKISCHVSSGTYIRSLGEDIGKALGVGAYLTELRRTRIGDYEVEKAIKLEDFMSKNGVE